MWAPPGILRLGPSLQLDQEKQEQVLTLLRQRAELEVWETQKALDQLLFKHQLEVSRPIPRARGLFPGMPHSRPRGGATPPAHPSPGPSRVDLALWLRGDRVPLWKVKLGRLRRTQCHLNRGPCRSLEVDSMAACQRPAQWATHRRSV